MKVERLKSWEHFEQASLEIISKNKEQGGKREGHVNYPLFRGQSNSEWHLESTLDRLQKRMSISKYLRIIQCVHKDIATCIGKKRNLVEDIDQAVAKGCVKINLGQFQLPLSDYEFMAYLRQNGFPSPLIDWTKSPYIAAYFAFRDICSTAKNVSIFLHKGKHFCGHQLYMRILGPTIATDRKHYLQQSEYSICFREENGELHFANHEDVEEQDVLIEYIIPMSERQKVLRKLDSMDITAYSLFDSETSLMETLALRDIVLDTDD